MLHLLGGRTGRFGQSRVGNPKTASKIVLTGEPDPLPTRPHETEFLGWPAGMLQALLEVATSLRVRDQAAAI